MYHGALARCPFCGAKVDMGASLDAEERPKAYFVACDTCGAHVFFDGIPSADNPEAALAAWNRRTAEQDGKTCPFCGGKVTIDSCPPEPEEAPECGIECEECHAYTSFWGAIDSNTQAEAETETLKRWSKRKI